MNYFLVLNEIFIFCFNFIMLTDRMNFETHFSVIAQNVCRNEQKDLLNSAHVAKDVPQTHHRQRLNIFVRVKCNPFTIYNILTSMVFNPWLNKFRHRIVLIFSLLPELEPTSNVCENIPANNGVIMLCLTYFKLDYAVPVGFFNDWVTFNDTKISHWIYLLSSNGKVVNFFKHVSLIGLRSYLKSSYSIRKAFIIILYKEFLFRRAYV